MHDANRRLTKITDPLGQQTVLGYNPIDELTSLTDPKNNTTGWAYDVEGRLTSKRYPDTSTVVYSYENTTSRLHSMLDALNQTKQYGYTEDDRLAGVTYLNPVNPTPNVSFTYDPYFPRLVSMADGNGTTQYRYFPVGALGALHLQQEQSPLANSAIGYVYDALGRISSRTVAGAGAETFGYDAIGRLTSHTNDLGAFTLSYLGQTGQIAQRQLSGSMLATAWGYLPNSGDRRLASIDNTGVAAGQYSDFAYTSTPEDLISGITETSDAATAYPMTGTQTASFNNLNQLTNLSGEALTWDADGNLLSDGSRNYAWDAENRLVVITYPGSPGKSTAFTYDGLGRRTAIGSTPAGGGSATTTSYLWCSARICQARNSANATTREYFAEGELVPGAPAQPYYYGSDQIGSVRRAFSSSSNAPAYAYDPFGVPLQATAPVTDFVYAGMFYNGDSGLYLTQHRAYDPNAGRWLSRDPVGEEADPVGNLYRYVGGNPAVLTDPSGDIGPLAAAAVLSATGAASYAGADLISQLIQNGGNFSCVSLTELTNAAVRGAYIGATFGLGAPGLGSGTAAPVARALSAGEDAPSVLRMPEGHLENALGQFASRGFTDAQAARLITNPELEPLFTGERIDTFFKDSLSADPNLGSLRITPRGRFGPDVFDPTGNTWYDVTTPGQWASHLRRYAPSFGQGNPLLYGP